MRPRRVKRTQDARGEGPQKDYSKMKRRIIAPDQAATRDECVRVASKERRMHAERDLIHSVGTTSEGEN